MNSFITSGRPLSVITCTLCLSNQCSLPYQATVAWPIPTHVNTHHVDVTTMYSLCNVNREGKLKPFDSLVIRRKDIWARLSLNLTWHALLTAAHQHCASRSVGLEDTHINTMNNARLDLWPSTYSKVTLSANPPCCLGTVRWTDSALARTFRTGCAKRRTIAVRICSCAHFETALRQALTNAVQHKMQPRPPDRPTLAYNLLHCISAWIDLSRP